MLTDAQTRGLLDIMVGTTRLKRDNLAHLYLGRAGDDLPAYLAEYFDREKKADVRSELLRFAGPAAPRDARVRALAERGLADRSEKVRKVALWLFALSAEPSSIPLLQAWQPKTAEDAAYRDRAIQAIERRDVQEWVRGTVYSGVVPWQFSRHEVGSAEFVAEVDRYIVRFAPDLVPDLERVLGDLHLRR